MVAQFVSSLLIFVFAIVGCGFYFIRTEIMLQGPWGDPTPYAVLPWTPSYDGGRKY